MKKMISIVLSAMILFTFTGNTLFAQENISTEQLNVNEVMSEKINQDDKSVSKNLINKISNKFQKFKNMHLKDLKQYLIKAFGITSICGCVLYALIKLDLFKKLSKLDNEIIDKAREEGKQEGFELAVEVVYMYDSLKKISNNTELIESFLRSWVNKKSDDGRTIRLTIGR